MKTLEISSKTSTFPSGCFCAIIVAGGSGNRFGSGQPKQFYIMGDRPVLRWSVDTFASCSGLREMVIVSHPDWLEKCIESVQNSPIRSIIRVVGGGEFRQDSCRIGLDELDLNDQAVVLIHDAARPWASKELILSVVSGVECGNDAVIPVLAAWDSMVVVQNNIVTDYANRSSIGHVQTPQGFRLGPIREAHRTAWKVGNQNYTDDGSIMLAAGFTVAVVPGDPANRKLTVPEDAKAV